jgi:hypothetical protein
MPTRYFGRPTDSKLACTGQALTIDQARELIGTTCWYYYADNRRQPVRPDAITVDDRGITVTMTQMIIATNQPLLFQGKVLKQDVTIPKDGTLIWDD